MKKLLLAAAILGSALCASAQESYAPKAGDLSTEIQFTPFKSTGESFAMPALNLHYYVTDNDALLLEIGLGGRNTKSVANTDNANSFEKGYYGTFSIDLGYMRHFYQYKRLGLYAGGKIGYIHDFAGSKSQVDDNNWTWTNRYGDEHVTGNGFEVYAFTGLDFYVYKGLYLGAEINLGFRDVLASNYTVKTKANGVETESKSKAGGHDFVGGFSCQPRLRLGWTF